MVYFGAHLRYELVPPVLPTSHRIWTNPTIGHWDKLGDASPRPSPPGGYATEFRPETETRPESHKYDWLRLVKIWLAAATWWRRLRGLGVANPDTAACLAINISYRAV